MSCGCVDLLTDTSGVSSLGNILETMESGTDDEGEETTNHLSGKGRGAEDSSESDSVPETVVLSLHSSGRLGTATVPSANSALYNKVNYKIYRLLCKYWSHKITTYLIRETATLVNVRIRALVSWWTHRLTLWVLRSCRQWSSARCSARAWHPEVTPTLDIMACPCAVLDKTTTQPILVIFCSCSIEYNTKFLICMVLFMCRQYRRVRCYVHRKSNQAGKSV